MTITYEWTPELLRKALRLHRRRTRTAWLARLSLLIVLDLAALVLVFVWANAKLKLGADVASGVLPIMLLAVLYALLAHLYPLWGARRSWKNLMPPHIKERTVVIELSDDSITYSLPLISQAKIDWSVICRTIANPDLTMLYLTKKTFLVIPSVSVAGSDRDAFDDLLRRKVIKRKC